MSDLVRVLVVDADDEAAMKCLEPLPADIFKTRREKSGAVALNTYKAFEPDIVVLDLQLPGDLSGMGLLKELCKDPAVKRMTLFVVTAKPDKETVLACMKMGVHGFLAKPFEPRQFFFKLLAAYEKVVPQRAKSIKTQLTFAR